MVSDRKHRRVGEQSHWVQIVFSPVLYAQPAYYTAFQKLVTKWPCFIHFLNIKIVIYVL